MQCKFDKSWAGMCKNESTHESGMCDEHENSKCASCGKRAVRECDQTGIQFVCGAPLCADCQHGVPEKGKEGWFLLGGGHVTKERHEAQMKSRYGNQTS